MNGINPDCDECGGEGWCVYGGFRNEIDGCKELPCQKCFPKMSWADIKADEEADRYDDY